MKIKNIMKNNKEYFTEYNKKYSKTPEGIKSRTLFQVGNIEV